MSLRAIGDTRLVRSWNMLRPLGLIAVCACIVASVGCDGGASAPSPVTVTVELSGRVVNADTGDSVGNVRVSAEGYSNPPASATSGGDGTFTLNLPRSWAEVNLKLTGLGYDERFWRFEPNMAGTRAEIRMYPTLVIRPDESIEVRVESTISRCAFAGPFACRRVLVEASPGEPVELEIVPHDTSKPMGLTADMWDEEPELRLMVAPGSLAYVVWAGTDAAREGRLTARR